MNMNNIETTLVYKYGIKNHIFMNYKILLIKKTFDCTNPITNTQLEPHTYKLCFNLVVRLILLFASLGFHSCTRFLRSSYLRLSV